MEAWLYQICASRWEGINLVYKSQIGSEAVCWMAGGKSNVLESDFFLSRKKNVLQHIYNST
jgi:hypothetical protein